MNQHESVSSQSKLDIKLTAVARVVETGKSSAINATVRCAAAKAGGKATRGGEAGKR